jgi:hypothetical protein
VSGDWRPPATDPFVRLTDEGQLADAIAARNEERELRQQASELATFAGTMRDLAEARRHVTVRCATGRSYRGQLLAVAVDHLVVRAGDRATVHVATDQVSAVTVDPAVTTGWAAGDRDAAQDRTLDEVLARAVEARPTVVLVTRGDGEVHRGRLLAVGEDVVSVRGDGVGQVRYLPVTALSELVIE